MSARPPSEPVDLGELDSFAVELGRRRARARLLGEALDPVRVGHFALERQLGAGGMGTVYLARDEQLDRGVALKFLRDRDDAARGAERLLREAQGLARISHPNVVPVFEVGEHGGRVWIAMEYVIGRTLRAWIASDAPTGTAVLDAWLAAGEGLAAVHAAGLVHRDIKPDNVMLGDDGRVRLVDFGLVCAPRSPASAHELQTTEMDLQSREQTTRSGPTGTGSFVGTWAYAAPEQRRGGAIDARADQFSFCVCVVEALTGERPRPEDAEPPLRGVSSRRVRVALQRGLARSPEHRHPDMRALLDALAPRSRRWVGPAVVGLAGAAALTLALVRQGATQALDDTAVCSEAARGLERSWGSAQRQRLEQSFGPELARSASASIDDWSASWAEVAREACERVHVDKLASPASLDASGGCLAQARAELDNLFAGLTDARPSAYELSRWIAELPDPRACLDDATPPSTEAELAELTELREALFRVRYGIDEPKLDLRRARARALLERARDRGLVTGEINAALTLGALAALAGDRADATEHFGAVLDLAERERLDGPRIEAWVWLASVALDFDLDVERARWLLSRARQTTRDLDFPNRQRALVARLDSRVALAEGDLEQAERLARAAVDEYTALGPQQAWNRGVAVRNLAQVMRARGRKTEATELLAALDSEQHFGASLAGEIAGGASTDAGVDALMRGALDEAERLLGEALDAVERRHGPESPQAAEVHVALVAVYDARGELDMARAHAQIADAIVRTTLGPLHVDRTYALSGLGAVAYRERDYEAAIEAFELCSRIAEAGLDPRSPDLARHQLNLADALALAGRGREAEALVEPAIETLEQALGADAFDLAIAHKVLGVIALGKRDLERARVELERAIAIHSRDSEPLLPELAQTRWLLAQTLAALDEPVAALDEAEQAEQLYADQGPAWRPQQREIQAWLATRTNKDPEP